MFIQGSIYRRRDLHRLYGGQQQGDISTPAGQNYILLFTSDTGEQYGYRDGWAEDGVYLYTGEGQLGDMDFVRGNLAIHEHAHAGKDLHLFKYIASGRVQYEGQMVYTGYHERIGPDMDGNDRRLIVFELASLNAFDATVAMPDDEQRMNCGGNRWKRSANGPQRPLQPLQHLRTGTRLSGTGVTLYGYMC